MSRSVWLWRWRRNPLLRRSYAVEAWSLLAVGLVAVVAASLTGIAVAGVEQHRLAVQRSQRHTAVAVLTDDSSDGGGYPSQTRAPVRWTAPDGSRRYGSARVSAGLKSGARITIWTNRRGEIVSAPLSGVSARVDADIAGAGAAGGLCLAVLAGWQLAVRVGDRRRAELWAAEWAEVGPRWDHRNA